MTLGALYKQSLGRIVGQQQVFDYANKDDFSDLWGEGENGKLTVLKKIDGKESIVIVWDGRSQDESDSTEKLLTPHLTPLDWALAFSTKALGAESPPSLRIHIVDLTGKKHDEWAMRMRHQLLVEMPWVTLHAPLIPVAGNGEKAAYREGYLPIIDGLLEKNGGDWKLKTAGKSLSAGARMNLVYLSKQWAATLTHSDDHHDINNIIGPDLLAKGKFQKNGPTRSMLTRLRWSDGIVNCDTWESYPAAKNVKDKLFGRPLSLLVIDDQLHQGWGRFACRLFSEGYNDATEINNNLTKINSGNQLVRIYGSLGPDPLIEFLKKAKFDHRNYCSQIIHPSGPPEPEIIFLDLRLYSSTSKAREQTSILINDVIQNRVFAPLAWPAIAEDELQRIKAWCEERPSSLETTDEALLLLPRLLALALPLTPIILFSSTGQTWIRERLKPYHNIITSFEKPRVLSNPDSIKSAIAALRDGLDKSVAMMRLRLQLAHAQKAFMIAEADKKSLPRLTDKSHVEIFVDESGEIGTGIISGLAMTIFNTREVADNLQIRLETEHNIGGAVWAGKKGDRIETTSYSMLKKGTSIYNNPTLCETQLQSLASVLDSSGIDEQSRALWSVIATKARPRKLKTDSVSLAVFPDGPLDDVLRFNIEFALGALLPYYSKKASWTIDIYLPTRVVSYLGVTSDGESFLKSLAVAFNLGAPFRDINDRNKYLLPTSQKGTGFPLLRGWLHAWDVVPGRIKKVCTEQLWGGKYITTSEASKYRLFHDIADWVCSASKKIQSDADGKWAWSPLNKEMKTKSIFKNWFVSTDGECLGNKKPGYFRDTDDAIQLMRALKTSSKRGSGENDAIRMVLETKAISDIDDRLLKSEYCASHRVILWALRDNLRYVRGTRLFSLLVSESPLGPQPPSTAPRETDEEELTPIAAPEESPTGASQAEPAQPEDIAGQYPEKPQESEEKLPAVVDEASLTQSFPLGRKYAVVHITKFGAVFFKPFGNDGKKGTHRVLDSSLALFLSGEGWHDSRCVFGVELPGDNDELGSDDLKRMNVVSAQLSDGRWKLWKPS